jgi:hypothetical protein
MRYDFSMIPRRRVMQGFGAMWVVRARATDTSAGRESQAWIEVWVDLSVPELASLPREQSAEREALRLRIAAQQDEVMDALRMLGAVEVARVQQLRNALAVRLPASQLAAARVLPGVRAVRVVRDVERRPPLPPGA